MSAVRNVVAGTGGVLQYSPLFRIEQYIMSSVQRLDSRRFAVTPIGHAQTVNVGSEEPETV